MLSLSPSSSFADRLRSAALAGGYETLIDTLGRLVGAVPMAAQQGLWETTVGPFPGAWHTDAGNHVLLGLHLAQQDLFLEDVVPSPAGNSYVVGWSDEPDWEREQRRNGRAGPRVRPRRPEDPLFQEYSARKARHATKQAELEKSEAFQAFLAQRAAHLAQEARKPHTMAGEREALKASRAHWRAVQQELQREADTAPVKRVIRKEVAATLHAAPLGAPTTQLLLEGVTGAPVMLALEPARASAPETTAAAVTAAVTTAAPVQHDNDDDDVIVKVGVSRRDAIDERNRLLDADYEARARRNAELLQLCGPGDVLGPLRAPGIGARRVDLTEGERSICRCGQSEFFPFCDMSHVRVNAELGTTFSPWRATTESAGADSVLVCGCGESSTRPLCDGRACKGLAVAQDVGAQRVAWSRASEAVRSAVDEMVRAYEERWQTWIASTATQTRKADNLNNESDVALALSRAQADNDRVATQEAQDRWDLVKALQETGPNATAGIERVTATGEAVSEAREALVLALRKRLVTVRRQSFRAADDSEADLEAACEAFRSFYKRATEIIQSASVPVWRDDASARLRAETASAFAAVETAGRAARDASVTEWEAPVTRARLLRDTLLVSIADRDDDDAHEAAAVAAEEAEAQRRAEQRAARAAQDEAEAALDAAMDAFRAHCKDAMALVRNTDDAAAWERDGPHVRARAAAAYAAVETAGQRARDAGAPDWQKDVAGCSALFDALLAAVSDREADEEDKSKAAQRTAEPETQRSVVEASADREAAEKAEREKVEREAAEKAEREKAERKAAEKAEREKAEKAERDAAQWEALQRTMRERQAQEAAAREAAALQAKLREDDERVAARLAAEAAARDAETEARAARAREADAQLETARRAIEQEQTAQREQAAQREASERAAVEKARAAADAQRSADEVEARERGRRAEQARREASERERAAKLEAEAAAEREREAALAEAAAVRRREREAAEAAERAAVAQRERERVAVERRLEEAERRKREREEAKAAAAEAAKSPRGGKSPRTNAAESEALARAAAQRAGAERAALSAQEGKAFMARGDTASGLERTRDIDVNTPVLGKKNALNSPGVAIPSTATKKAVDPDASRDEPGSTPGARTPLAPEQLPLCARLLEAAKARGNEPAYKYAVGNDWLTVSWEQYAATVSGAARALIALGVKRGERVLLLAESRPEWAIVSLATQLVGGVTVAVYPSSPAEALVSIIQEQLPVVLMTDDSAQLAKLRGRMSHVKHVVAVNCDTDDRRALQWEDFVAKGADVKSKRLESRVARLEPDGVALISYTEQRVHNVRGDDLRGVVLSHANELFAAETVTRTCKCTAADRLLAFMSLCNATERAMTMYMPILCGALVYYSCDLSKLHDHISAVQPTVIHSAPVLWERFEGVFRAKLGAKEPAALPSAVRKKLRKFIGCGRLRLGLSSGAALHPSTLKFYRSLDIPLLSVYTRTALSGLVTMDDADNVAAADVTRLGRAVPGMELRVERGQLFARGAGVCAAYYGQAPHKAGDWHATGDLASLDAQGRVRLAGRLDTQLTLRDGSAVAVEPLELELRASPYVSGAMVVALSGGVALGALLALEREALSTLATAAGVPVNEFAASPAALRLVERHVQAVNATLPAAQRVAAFRVLPREFSVREGECSPSMQVNRAVCERKFADLIKAMVV